MNIVRRTCFLLLMCVMAARSAAADEKDEKAAKAVDTKESRLLVCTLTRKGHPELALVKDDGTVVKQLTDSKYRNRYAAWSPDGKWIAFGTSDKSGAGLFVIDAEGNNFKRLTYGNDEGAAWSPDGKTIVFTHFLQGIDADRYGGGQLTRLVAIQFEDALRKPTSEDSELDNEDARANLTEGKAYEGDAAWSPDGKTIAFASTRGGNWRLYLMDPSGNGVRDLSKTDNPGGNTYPAWSPDGKRIAYTEQVGENDRQIFVIDADGKNKTQLTKEGDFNCYAAWSPDGQEIAFMSYKGQGDKGSLAVMKSDGSEQKIILRGEGAGHVGRPAWKPK